MGIDRGRRKPKAEQGSKDAGEQPGVAAVRSNEAPGDPEAYELLFGEAVRALAAQEASLDEIRVRAGTMLSAAGVISAFLGTAALTIASGLSTAGPNPTPKEQIYLIYFGILLGLVFLTASSVVLVRLLPARSNWTFRVGTHELLRDYIEAEPPATMPEIHRSVAWYLADAEAKNKTGLEKLYGQFAWASWLFIGNLLAWFLVLGEVVFVRVRA